MVAMVIQLLLSLQVATAPQPTAAAVLDSAVKATAEVHSVSYVVKRDQTDPSGGKHKGTTSILITKSPFRFRAERHEEGQPVTETAVSDGKTTQSTTNGTVEDSPTFGSAGPQAMIVTNDASFDVAATWHLLLDPDYLRKAEASGRLLFLWQDDVEDDPCSVIVYARDGWTDYFWISAKTGLPRATQRVSFQRGRAVLGPRYEIAEIHLDPAIPRGSFDFSKPPVASPESAGMKVATTVPPETEDNSTTRTLVGKVLPPLEVKDPQYKPLLLSDLKGQDALVTFWAPWCAPCLEELAALQMLQPVLRGKLRVVAIAVQDRRAKAIEFIQGHSQYSFSFFTDPDMEDEISRLATFFRIGGIPVNVLSDGDGQIVDYWFGFNGEGDLRRKLAKFLSPATP